MRWPIDSLVSGIVSAARCAPKKVVRLMLVPRLGAALLLIGCRTSVEQSLEQLRAQQASAGERLALLLRDAEHAEARRTRAEHKARESECRAEALRVDADAAALTSACARRHAEVLQCRANVAKAQADSTLFGCLAGIGVGIVTGGAGAPIALLGCAGGRVLGQSASICGDERCDPAPETAYRRALGREGRTLAMCGGWVGAELEERPTSGPRISGVRDNSDASRMGVRVDDVLLTVADQPTPDARALSASLAPVGIGEALVVVVAREGHVLRLRGVHAERTLGVSFGARVDVPRGRLVVARVTAGSPASQVGLQRGDQLVSLAGSPVFELDEARRVLRLVRVGSKLGFSYRRDTRLHDTSLTLAERKDPYAF